MRILKFDVNCKSVILIPSSSKYVANNINKKNFRKPEIADISIIP